MSELHSLPYSRSSLLGSSLGWDYHNLGVLDAEMPLVMGGIAQPSFSESDFSSGYLEDALVEFTQRSKRRRLQPPYYTDHEQSKTSTTAIELEKSFWKFNPLLWHQPSENFYCMSMNQIESFNGFSDEHINTSMSRISEEASILAEIKAQETISAYESPDSSSSSYKNPVTSKTAEETLLCIDPTAISAGSGKRSKRVIRRVVYPFALVKPGGREEEVTLNDINERILMPPTRPVRHPVGEFACRPCVSGKGAGLSGKAVVALTRIHTQGRGSITIIRTKG